MSYRDPAQAQPTSSSSQLPVPVTRQHIATQKCSKPSKMLRRPIGKDQILKWQASLHTCQAVNVDGERCGNAVHSPGQSRFCHNGWHVENSKYNNIIEMVARRRQLDEVNAARRKQEMAEQMALFESQFSPLSSADKTSSSSNQSSQLFMPNPQIRKQNGLQMRW
ncbi:hypothetical protein I305_01107 [Cryptococcus gattii E566]|nr:hypothetical protein I305_01107 [Cryptococcus gattii E566]KJE06098.1 hypothetical protein I311_00239 [Cryptococcus gattii NT-10]